MNDCEDKQMQGYMYVLASAIFVGDVSLFFEQSILGG